MVGWEPHHYRAECPDIKVAVDVHMPATLPAFHNSGANSAPGVRALAPAALALACLRWLTIASALAALAASAVLVRGVPGCLTALLP